MTRVLPVILPILGLAAIIAVVNLFGARLNKDDRDAFWNDPYDWQ